MNNFNKIASDKFENNTWYGRIRLLRYLHDLSIKELAEKCIITEKCVSNWEAGRSVPSKRNRKIIAEVLGVEQELIFENGDCCRNKSLKK